MTEVLHTCPECKQDFSYRPEHHKCPGQWERECQEMGLPPMSAARTMPVDRTEGRLNAAVLTYRADPSEANHGLLMAVMIEHNNAFLDEQTAEFQSRTRRKS